MWLDLLFSADLVTFTEEILNGKVHFLCSVWSDVELGFGAKAIITKAKRKDTATNQEVAKLKREGQRLVTSVLKKLFEKSPIKCDFVRFYETKVLQKRFKSFLNQFMVSKILSPNQCDSVMLEFYWQWIKDV